MKGRSIVVGLACAGMAVGGLVACEPTGPASTLTRPTAPVILTGAKLPTLEGTAPGKIVAYRHVVVADVGTWQQIPVQVDQRKVVGFGSQPADNTTPGTSGTVYGSGASGPTALQYADPNTFVGADDDPTFDSNDELVFMAFDAGGTRGSSGPAEPAGVVAGSGVQIRVDDPRASSEHGWVYLFEAGVAADPSAGKDYVDYRFALTSGAYKATYKRASGPNPETSKVTTSTYEIGFSDRWKETSWKVRSAGASGVDVLDGHMNQFSFDTCGRSNDTFSTAEGAFVANIDGPVRAIRSYVGANSGPRSERTHLMYRDREVVVTDLRVHPIPGIMDFIDHSSAAQGMKYRSSSKPNGVTVNGTQDDVPLSLPAWEAVDGPQGQVLSYNQFSSSDKGAVASPEHIYRDETSPKDTPCWGDSHYYGASGVSLDDGIVNTDPGNGTFATLQGRRVTQFGSPAADPSTIPTKAADWAADIKAPLKLTVTPYHP